MLSLPPCARRQKMAQWLKQARQDGKTGDQQFSAYCLGHADHQLNWTNRECDSL